MVLVAAAQLSLHPVVRIVTVAAVPGGLPLDPAANLVDRGEAEAYGAGRSKSTGRL